jgi:hypothetical protein
MRAAQLVHRGHTLRGRGQQCLMGSGSTLLIGKEPVEAAAAQMMGLASE